MRWRLVVVLLGFVSFRIWPANFDLLRNWSATEVGASRIGIDLLPTQPPCAVGDKLMLMSNQQCVPLVCADSHTWRTPPH